MRRDGSGAVVYREGKQDVSIPERPEIIAQREASRREAEAKRAEDMLEESVAHHSDVNKEGSTFEKEGISAQEASLIAEQLVQFVTEQEAMEEEGQSSSEIDFTSFESLEQQVSDDTDKNEEEA